MNSATNAQPATESVQVFDSNVVKTATMHSIDVLLNRARLMWTR